MLTLCKDHLIPNGDMTRSLKVTVLEGKKEGIPSCSVIDEDKSYPMMTEMRRFSLYSSEPPPLVMFT